MHCPWRGLSWTVGAAGAGVGWRRSDRLVCLSLGYMPGLSYRQVAMFLGALVVERERHRAGRVGGGAAGPGPASCGVQGDMPRLGYPGVGRRSVLLRLVPPTIPRSGLSPWPSSGIRAKAVRGFKSLTQARSYPYLASFLGGTRGVCPLRAVLCWASLHPKPGVAKKLHNPWDGYAKPKGLTVPAGSLACLDLAFLLEKRQA